MRQRSGNIQALLRSAVKTGLGRVRRQFVLIPSNVFKFLNFAEFVGKTRPFLNKFDENFTAMEGESMCMIYTKSGKGTETTVIQKQGCKGH